jgi:hypothetical protein
MHASPSTEAGQHSDPPAATSAQNQSHAGKAKQILTVREVTASSHTAAPPQDPMILLILHTG